MNVLTKILSAAGAAVCLATPLAASAQPADFHHDEWRGRGFHEHVWRGHEWRGAGWRDAGWREDWRDRRGWGPAFYGMPAPVIYDAPDYGRDYPPVAYEQPGLERPIVDRVYERPVVRHVRVTHRVVRHAVHRAVSCAVPAHRR